MRIWGKLYQQTVVVDDHKTQNPQAILELYPNPFKSKATIQYNLAQECKINLAIYNIAGQKVKTLIEQKQYSGNYEIIWDGKDDLQRKLPAGVYYIRLSVSDHNNIIKKLVFIR